MKATQKQFEIISGILDLGLSKIEAGGNDLQGFLEECAQFATECRDTYALWLLLKIGRAHKYPAGDSWAFNDELEEAGSTLNDAHILTAMKQWLKDKLKEDSAPLTFNSYEAIKAGETTDEQALEGLEGFLNIIVDALESEDPSLTIERAGFGERWPLIYYLVSMEPAGTVSLPIGYPYFSLTVGDEIRITVLDEDGAPFYSAPLMLQAQSAPARVSRELGRRAFLGAEWVPYVPEHALRG
jgi:hypothetical protein